MSSQFDSLLARLRATIKRQEAALEEVRAQLAAVEALMASPPAPPKR